MKTVALLATLIALLGGSPVLGQEIGDPSLKPAATIGLFGGVGSGPIDAAAWGFELSVPVWRRLSATAEASGWGNGFGGTHCIAMPPDSHRCSVSGWAGLMGFRLSLPLSLWLGGFGEIGGGRFSRDWIGDERVNSVALSLKAGIRVRIRGPLDARFGGRFLRVFDKDYEALLEEKLEYLMGTVGFAFRLGS